MLDEISYRPSIKVLKMTSRHDCLEVFCENKRGDQLLYTFTGLFFIHIIKLITVNKQAII